METKVVIEADGDVSALFYFGEFLNLYVESKKVREARFTLEQRDDLRKFVLTAYIKNLPPMRPGSRPKS